MIAAVDAGAILIGKVHLEDANIHHDEVRGIVDYRWKPGNAPNRAAHAAVAFYELRGLDPGTIHLHGKDLLDRVTPYYAGFGCRYLRHIPRWFTDHAGVEHLEIPRQPTMKQPLVGLDIKALAADEFTKRDIWIWSQFGAPPG